MPELVGERSVGSARLRRARTWLGAAFFVHCSLIVYVGCSAAGGSIRPIAAAVAAPVLAVTPLVLLVRRERRSSAAGRPSWWVMRGLATVPVHAVGVAIALAGTAAWTTITMIAAAVWVVELVPVVLAARALRRPLSADLGELDIEIDVKVRSSESWRPSSLAQDDVRLTDERLIITVRPGPTWGYAMSIALAAIRDVEVRQADERDGPWFTAAGGPVLMPPPGDVVAIHHGDGLQILPVFDPTGFAEVLRARVERTARGLDRP
jgi:hypothetical protein